MNRKKILEIPYKTKITDSLYRSVASRGRRRQQRRRIFEKNYGSILQFQVFLAFHDVAALWRALSLGQSRNFAAGAV